MIHYMQVLCQKQASTADKYLMSDMIITVCVCTLDMFPLVFITFTHCAENLYGSVISRLSAV